MNSNEKNLLFLEKNFKSVANISQDITIYPLSNDVSSQVETDKKKSKEFSEVFTPLWLVDQMIDQVKWKNDYAPTLDLCAGYGQFTIRLMRHHFNKFPDFDLKKFVKNHYLSELQLSSCYKLLRIFGPSINLFIGDSVQLGKLPKEASGIWIYLVVPGYWVCVTKTVVSAVFPNKGKGQAISEKKFVSKIELLISYLNNKYSIIKNKMMRNLKEMNYNDDSRLKLFDRLNETYSDDKDSWQNINTPKSIVEDLIEGVDDLEHKSILVLFNCEIVEQLIRKLKIPAEQIIFATNSGAGNELKAKFVKKMYGVDYSLFKTVKDIRVAFGGRKFDICLSNPPYNRGLDLKILNSLLGEDATETTSIAKEYVIVHPSTWLIDAKDKTPIYLKLKEKLKNKIVSVKLFNGNPIFNITQRQRCQVIKIDVLHTFDKVNVILDNSKFIVEHVCDITKFGAEWLTLVKPFVNNIKKLIEISGQVWEHNTRTIQSNKIYAQVAAIRGHESKDPAKMVADDFYTMLVSVEYNKGIRMADLERPGNPMPTFEFDTVVERDNFLHYLNTDFARFCLALLKQNSNLSVGEMELIPWMDFTQSWDDDKLFKYFDVNQETQDYIRKFLPDYYGIRK